MFAMNKYDVIIIGAGITGSAISRELSRYELNILWLEKESDVCMGTSCANSAIIHAGYDAVPGTLKSVMNVQGNHLWPQLSQDLDIPFRRTGSYVVAVDDSEHKTVCALYERGRANQVSDLQILEAAEMKRRVPAISKEVRSGLWAGTTGVIDPFQATLALAENAVANGVELSLETHFLDFIRKENQIIGVLTNKGKFYGDWIINCAGVYADEVMHKAGVHKDFRISARKGEYMVFDSAHVQLNDVLFPAPSEKGKGILVTTTAHGNVMIGPNSSFVEDKEDKSITAAGLQEVFENARRLVPSLESRYIIAEYSGLRATGNQKPHKDFLIELSKEAAGLVNVAGIESPGFASAPAIAEYVTALLAHQGLPTQKRKEFSPYRQGRPRLKSMSHPQRQALISKNPAYGRVVCRCEHVTEGEILDAIHSVIPARTYDAVKRRTWLGTGRCQGGFDYSRTIEILARELGISVMQVTKKGFGSEFIYRETKDVI